MAKYIDAIELAEKIKNTPSSIDKFPQYDRYDGAAWRQFEILDMIKEMPAADVAPVVQGQWIFGEIGPVGCTVKCSVCGWGCNAVDPVLWVDYAGHKYCGSCGAKMDNGDDE